MARSGTPGEKPAQSPGRIDRTDGMVALVLLGLCAGLAYVTARFDEVPELLAQNVPPEAFPRILLAIIAALALILPFEHRFNPSWPKIRLAREQPAPVKCWTTVALLAAVGAAAPYLGTLVTIFAICLLLPLVWGERRLVRVALFAAAFTLAITGLFNGLLKVHFEPGVLAAGWLWPG